MIARTRWIRTSMAHRGDFVASAHALRANGAWAGGRGSLGDRAHYNQGAIAASPFRQGSDSPRYAHRELKNGSIYILGAHVFLG